MNFYFPTEAMVQSDIFKALPTFDVVATDQELIKVNEFNASPETVPLIDDGVPASAQNLSSTSQKNIMQKIKSFIVAQPLRAVLIVIAAGFLIGYFVPSLFKRKGRYK